MIPYFSFEENETRCRHQLIKMLEARGVDLKKDVELHNALDVYAKAYYAYQSYKMKLVEDSKK